ncbi:type II secretion system F family protein [Nitrolancea hollandica]|nr:type II secretion system F family protein [Nitrolancea hollandica]
MNGIGVHPFGSWPVWVWLAGFAAGFLAPDWDLARRRSARRAACLLELPAILDLLTIAASAGLALEQALSVVAQQSNGVIARELQRATREVALGQQSLVAALEAVAERNEVPELTGVIGRLRAAHEQGLPLIQTLSAQTEGLREQKRFRIVAEGEKAAIRMILPVAFFILPVIFVVLLVPAALELMRLGG